LMEALEGRAELFAALQDDTHEYWIENRECRPYVRELILFGSKQLTPVLFAAWDRFNVHDFARATKLISRFVFRYTIVSSLNPNVLEPLSYEIASGILDGSIQGPRQLHDRLRPFQVDDEKFKQDFAVLTINTGGRRRKVAKYILCHLETDQSGRACDPDTDPATIEHILPENPTADWAEQFPEEKWDEYIYRLGNLALLEPSLNRQIGNRPYAEKLEGYARSQYRTTSTLPDLAPEAWTPQLVEHRQRKMADRAAHLWRSDFE
ncbi:MAG TPA: HNH endonuclease, partial [Gammaproteobacteria bacterium]|nr:HNH endonuclease [Gammaproteobacteria bacterium]